MHFRMNEDGKPKTRIATVRKIGERKYSVTYQDRGLRHRKETNLSGGMTGKDDERLRSPTWSISSRQRVR